jgi:isocitrate dehydrogenase (NAD+)
MNNTLRINRRLATSIISQNNRCYASDVNSGKARVTLFPGHGIGPEISRSVEKVLDHAGANIEWERFNILTTPDEQGNLVTKQMLDSVLNNGIALKGPLATPIGTGYRSVNIAMRKALELYANVRPALSLPIAVGKQTEKQKSMLKYPNINLVTVRENTEGMYSGLEHEVVPGVIECLKVVTKRACDRIAKYAFEYARINGRKQVTAVHKANIMKRSDGLFLDCVREIAKQYPDIKYNEKIIDATCMELVLKPEEFDVMVTLNLYGDILSDLCAGLVGGLGLTPSGNYGEKAQLFEAVHGTAPDIAGKDWANPTAFLLSSVMMLEYMNKRETAARIRTATLNVLANGDVLTGDLGGNATNTQFTEAIIKELNRL